MFCIVLYCLVWRDFPTFLWYSLLLIQPSEDSLNRAPLDQSYSGADEQRQLGCMRWTSDFSAFKASWYLFRHPVRSKKHGLTEQASYTSQHQPQIILHTRHSDILLLASAPSSHRDTFLDGGLDISTNCLTFFQTSSRWTVVTVDIEWCHPRLRDSLELLGASLAQDLDVEQVIHLWSLQQLGQLCLT